MNDKVSFKPPMERVHGLGISFRAVLADAQYSSEKAQKAVVAYGAEPIIPVRRDSRVREASGWGRTSWSGEHAAW